MSDYYYKAEDVRPLVSGNWLVVLDQLAPHLKDAINKPGKHVACPIHGGKDGFRLYNDVHNTGGGVCNTCGAFPDGFELLMWANHWDFSTALEAVGDIIGAPQHMKAAAKKKGKVTPLKAVSKPAQPVISDERKQWLEKITEEVEARAAREKAYRVHLGKKVETLWNQCVPLTHESAGPGRSYLINRKLSARGMDSNAIRFHPELPYYDEDGELKAKCPALVMAIRNVDGELQTLHRIFLTRTGLKARVGNPKKMMSLPEGTSVTGASIPLVDLDGSNVLSLAEGPETASAAYRVYGIPAWSTVNATLLEHFEVPEGVDTLLIWADKDSTMTGENSAEVLRNKVEPLGIKVHIFTPAMPIPKKSKGVDWNDVLMEQGILGFPRRELIMQAIKFGRKDQEVA